jgi:hypothetical protein
MTRFPLIAFAAASLLAAACAKPQVTSTPEVTEASVANRPRTLEDAMKGGGLTPITLTEVSTEHSFGSPVATKPGQISASYTQGWNGQNPVFARRADGKIVRVIDKPNIVVDRHVDGGCLRFAGGRQEMVTGVFELPAGAAYAGEVDVVYDKHTEVVDYTNDPSCPPPALD